MNESLHLADSVIMYLEGKVQPCSYRKEKILGSKECGGRMKEKRGGEIQ